ncbi:hypothetical protein AXF42_Ash016317 [Apostasia shenzhenica]|uniref:Uncharacterized protein n=1 Tax=Apostasia shenzhenica TaxID=1088818 RepID=A0A2H9ZXD8_9ASPA|nr:hypothetical protein AXF42_Ash016317 [Apostasia shenzhenica]
MAFIIRLIIVVLLAATIASSRPIPISPNSLLGSYARRKMAESLCRKALTLYQSTNSRYVTSNCSDMKQATMQTEVDGDRLFLEYRFEFDGIDQRGLSVRIRLRLCYLFDGVGTNRVWVDQVIIVHNREL